MSTTQSEAPPSQTTLRQDLMYAARYYLRGWRGVLAVVAVVAVPALWLGGPWLLAVGAVPLLISVAPCLAMCAVGLCAMKNCSKKVSDSGSAADAPPAQDSILPADPAVMDAARRTTRTSRD